MSSTHTHVGHKTATNYQHTGRNWGHTAPAAGKLHALNANRGHYRSYLSLCGERVSDDAGEMAGQYLEANANVFPAGERPVTCKRCLAKIRAAEKLEPALPPAAAEADPFDFDCELELPACPAE